MMLGAGSNVLIGDKGFDGIVIKLTGDFAECKLENYKLNKRGVKDKTFEY